MQSGDFFFASKGLLDYAVDISSLSILFGSFDQAICESFLSLVADAEVLPVLNVALDEARVLEDEFSEALNCLFFRFQSVGVDVALEQQTAWTVCILLECRQNLEI